MICGSIWIPLITLAVNWAGVKIYEKLDSEHTQTKKYKITEKTEPSIPEVIPKLLQKSRLPILKLPSAQSSLSPSRRNHLIARYVLIISKKAGK